MDAELESASADAGSDDQLVQSLESRCLQLEDTVLNIGRDLQASEQTTTQGRYENSQRLHDFICARKQARVDGSKSEERISANLVQT